jgi:hypothetical protein
VDAARSWRQKADELDGATGYARGVAGSLPVQILGPCPVRDTLDDCVGVTVQNLLAAAREFRTLADECVRRSRICAAFDADARHYRVRMAEWERSGVTMGLVPPPRPWPPAAWAETEERMP